MKKVYALSVFMVMLGVLYLVTGVLGILSITGWTVDPLFRSIMITMVIILLLGGFTLTSAVGIICQNRFARKFWLGFSIFLFAFHLLWLTFDIYHGATTIDMIEPLVVLLLVLFSWKILRTHEIITMFGNKGEESSNKIFHVIGT